MADFNEKVLGLVDERLRSLAVACDDNYGAMKRLAKLIRSVATPYLDTEYGYNGYNEIESTSLGRVVSLGDDVPTSRPSPATSTTKEFFWPSLPSLPSMFLVSPSDPNENYVSVETMYSREYQLLEYANAVKKVATDLVDEVNAGPEVPHSKAWYMKLADDAARSEQIWNKQWEEARVANKRLEQENAELKRKLDDAKSLQRATEGITSVADIPACEQAAKQQGINWCIKLLQRIADEHDDKASRMVGYNVRARAGNELREAIAKIRKEEQGMWADG